MASFVREILSATGRLGEKEDYSGKAARLRASIDDLKAGLRGKIEARYTDFSASFAEVSQQISQLEDVLREVDSLETTIQHHFKPGMAEMSRESAEVLRQMKELSASTTAAKLIRTVYETMECANEHIDRRQFIDATKKLQFVEDSVRKVLSQDQTKQDDDTVKAFKSIKIELQNSQEKIHYILCNEWDQIVRIEKSPNQPEETNLKRIVVGLEDGQAAVKDLILSMHASDVLAYRMNRFGVKLLAEIVQPMLAQRVLEFDVYDDQEHYVEIKFDQPTTGKPDPLNVLDYLARLFSFLAESFDVPIAHSGPDAGKTFMESLGTLFGCSVKELLVKECLSPAVPSSKKDLADYSQIVEATENLQMVLTTAKFFDNSSGDILVFARNVDSAFANKRCQSILAKGREIMKEDLHSVKEIDPSKGPTQEELEETVIQAPIDPSVEEDLLPLPKGMALDKSLFDFPKCQVSLHVLKIVELVNQTLEEACDEDTTPFFSGRLLITARNLMEMYCDVVPVYHAESLRQFPQITAIAYNNFFYLAHECLTLGMTCNGRLKPPLNSRPVTFADITPRLRQTGVDVFLAQMRRQRDDVRAIIKDSSTGFGQLTGSELLPAKSEKCLRQVLLQLHHLRRLWQDVLPRSVYCKTMGTILNTVVEDLVQKVLPLEDIAADAATQLCSLFSTLQEQGPDVFVLDGQPDSSRGDVVRYVRKWNKFKEVIVVLNASLREIEDRWAGGKGPLAVEFSPEEVKRLIRALFQNSDRRAAVLAKIKFDS